jgi:hypothetical protein
VIEDEVLKITTVDKANEKLSIRMYPVGDLIMGPQQLQALAGAGGGGGVGGGQGGGMGGGMGGGGMGGGGMGGGGMGGGGGGMFSIPSEPIRTTGAAPVPNANPMDPVRTFPAPPQKRLHQRAARTTDNSAAQSASGSGTVFAQADDSPAFTNDAVQASKKKRNDAR